MTFILILLIIIHYIRTDPLAGYTFSYSYFFLILAISIIGFYISNSFSQKKDPISLLSSFLFFAFVLLIAYIAIHFHYIFEVVSKSYMSYFLLFFIAITGFTIFYNVLKNTSMPINSNFFLSFIFFIPCLITDFIQYIGVEYQTTPNVVFILFIIEIILVLLYLYLPQFITRVSQFGRIAVLEKSMFLDKEAILGNSDSFLINGPNPGETSINQSYAITFWVNISSPEKTSETEIFNYGNHPRLTYYNNTDNTKEEQDKFIVYFTNADEKTSHHFSAPRQKWNYIVVNYGDNGICDLFLNGELIKSANISPPTYNSSENISVGSDRGIYGAISNVNYYRNPLTLSQITTTYNLLMFKNPPEFD